MKPLRSIPSRLLCLFIVPALLLAPGAVTPAAAFDFFGWFDPSSPVIHLPRLQAEFSARPSLKTIRGGSLEIPELGVDLDLRDDFGFTDSSFFIDLMTRLQLGRLGVRTHVSFRDSKASRIWIQLRSVPDPKRASNTPRGGSAAILTSSGISVPEPV